MLPAPASRLALPAPRVAGLLPANVPLKIVLEPFSLLDMFGLDLDDDSPTPFQTIEEADAEIAPHLERAAAYLAVAHALRARRERRQ